MINPRLGAFWEGFAMEQLIHVLQLPEVYFWSICGSFIPAMLPFRAVPLEKQVTLLPLRDAGTINGCNDEKDRFAWKRGGPLICRSRLEVDF